MLIKRHRILLKLESRCTYTYGNVTLCNDGMSRQRRSTNESSCRFKAVTLSKQQIVPTIVLSSISNRAFLSQSYNHRVIHIIFLEYFYLT